MKTDAALGKEIHDYLVSKNVESPIDYKRYDSMSNECKITEISNRLKESLEIMGFDLTNDSVCDTPKRVAKMWVQEIMSGLDYDKFPRIMTFDNKFGASSMVVQRNVKSMSLCSHHMVTIDGKAQVAYIPKNKVIGLSKIARIVDFFSRRPQEAERLTLQIFYALQYVLETDDVAVYLEGVHYCMKCRGVNDSEAFTSTVHLGGVFESDHMVRKEFYDLVNSK